MNVKRGDKPVKRIIKYRHLVQLLFFVLIAAIAINKTLVETGGGIEWLSTASLHAICPFGGVVTLYELVTQGDLIQKIHLSSLVLMGLVFTLALLAGPVFCSWICPLGSVQEGFSRLGRRIFKKRFNQFVPRRLDHLLRYGRYLVLAWVVYATARSASLIFSDYDPYQALFSLWEEDLAVSGALILAVTLLGALFVERPWCKYACPYGALLGLFNKVRIFKIRRNPATCIACNKCDRACPMNIQVSEMEVVKDVQCISCLECTSENQCPVADTVNLQIRSFQKEES